MSAALDRRLTPVHVPPSGPPARSLPIPIGMERFFADAIEALAEQADLESVLRAAVQLPVPFLADICVLDLRLGKEQARRIVTQHSDPSSDVEQRAFTDAHLPRPPAARSPVSAVFAHGDTLMHTVFGRIAHTDTDDGSLASILVGIRDESAVVGVLSFLAHQPDRQFGPADRQAAEAYARRVSRAVRSARRCQEDRDGRVRAESQLEVFRHTAEVLTHCTEALRRELVEARLLSVVTALEEGAPVG